MPKVTKGVPQAQHVDKAVDKVDIKTRTNLSALLDTKGPQSPIWQAQQGVKDSGLKLVEAGKDLLAADVEYQDALVTAEAKKTTLETKLGAWNGCYDLYVSNVEVNALKPEDVSLLALTPLTRTVYTLSEPLSITLRNDLKAHLLRIKVKLPKGMSRCEIEVSTDGTTYKRLLGSGMKRTIPAPAPGTYWVRAAAVRASEQSAFIAPVQIVVK